MAERTHEIGVRVAVGATPVRIARLVLREGLGVAVLGIASDLWASALLVVAAAACLVPTARALRVDPAVALRVEPR